MTKLDTIIDDINKYGENQRPEGPAPQPNDWATHHERYESVQLTPTAEEQKEYNRYTRYTSKRRGRR